MQDLIGNIKIILVLVLIPVGSVLIIFILSKLPELWRKHLPNHPNADGDMTIPPLNAFSKSERFFYLFLSVLLSALIGFLGAISFFRCEGLGCMVLLIVIPYVVIIAVSVLTYPIYFFIKKILKKS